MESYGLPSMEYHQVRFHPMIFLTRKDKVRVSAVSMRC